MSALHSHTHLSSKLFKARFSVNIDSDFFEVQSHCMTTCNTADEAYCLLSWCFDQCLVLFMYNYSIYFAFEIAFLALEILCNIYPFVSLNF